MNRGTGPRTGNHNRLQTRLNVSAVEFELNSWSEHHRQSAMAKLACDFLQIGTLTD